MAVAVYDAEHSVSHIKQCLMFAKALDQSASDCLNEVVRELLDQYLLELLLN